MRTRHKELSKNPKLVEAGIVKLMVKKKSGAGDGTRTRDSLLGRQLPLCGIHQLRTQDLPKLLERGGIWQSRYPCSRHKKPPFLI